MGCKKIEKKNKKHIKGGAKITQFTMNELAKDKQLGNNLTYQAEVPLRWHVPEQPLDASRTLQLQNQNEGALNTILELGNIHSEVNEEQRESFPDLARLEFKVDLALELLHQIYAREISLPDVCSLTLSTTYAEWVERQPPEEHQHIHLEIFLDPKYPRPLIFPALVQKVCAQNGCFKITVALEFPGEPVSESLEKLIFRHHRRSIALSR